MRQAARDPLATYLVRNLVTVKNATNDRFNVNNDKRFVTEITKYSYYTSLHNKQIDQFEHVRRYVIKMYNNHFLYVLCTIAQLIEQ